MVAKLTITALHSAVKECRLKAAEDSIKHYGIPKSRKKTTDYLVLQTALDKNHTVVVKLLIKAGCRINPNENEKDNDWTPLAWAVIRGSIEIAMLLLNKGATSEAGNKSGLTVLHLAIRKKALTMTRLLLSYMNVNLVDSKGKTALQTFFQVAYNQFNVNQQELVNNNEILKLLLTKGASMNFENDASGYTPIHYAVMSKQLDLIDRIIQNNVNVNVQCKKGDTPLHVLLSDKSSYRKGALDILKRLVRNRADINISNNQNETLLHILLSSCHGNEEEIFELIQFLVEQGADINAQNRRNESACHLAARKKCFRVLHLFFRRRECQINLQDYEDNTILHRLLQNSRTFKSNDAFIEIVTQVLVLRPALEIRNKEGKTPLDLTIQNLQSRLLGQMLAENINVNAVDENGNTVLHNFLIHLIEKNCRIDNSHVELIEMLSANGVNVDLANIANKTAISLVFDLKKKSTAREYIYNMLIHLVNHSNNLNIIENGKSLIHILSALKKPFTEAEDMKAAELVDLYLQKGARVDKKNNLGFTALCLAVTNKQLHVAKALLQHAADPNAYVPSSEATILECLLRLNDHTDVDVEIAGALLSHGATIDESPDSEFSLLRYVTSPNKLKLCSKLIAHSKHINVVDDQGNTALHMLLKSQPYINESVELKISKVAVELVLKGDMIDSQNNQGLAPLHLAVRHKLFKVTEELLNLHANPLARDNEGNCTLHFLDQYRCETSQHLATKVVRLLIQFGCDVNTSNKKGTTPLASAVRKGCPCIVQTLISYKADVNSPNEDLLTPLHLAAEYHRTRTSELLIKYRADVNAKTSDGKTALHVAVVNEANNIIEILLKNGADPDMTDSDGETAIFLACRHSKFEIVKKFLNIGADINIADNTGKVPTNSQNLNVRMEIFRHIQKLKAANMFLSHENLRHNQINVSLYDECVKEIAKLKEMKIDSQKSLADVLQMSQHRLSTFKSNEDFQKLINAADFDDQFPHYASLLKACYTRGLIRNTFLADAKMAFRQLLEVPFPDVCCDSIFNYLTNDNLQELITAGRLKNKSLKRKRASDGNDVTTRPANKRLRRLSA